MKLAGYLIVTEKGVEGEEGSAYNYLLASNGVFISAASKDLSATIPIAECAVRGLAPIEPRVSVHLAHGKVPRELFERILGFARYMPDTEFYYCIRWDEHLKEYLLEMPAQNASAARVEYTPYPGAIMDIHSHGGMKAFFSSTDDADEQGFRLYMVLGSLDKTPEIALRVGVYGYYADVLLDVVFDQSKATA